jgi:hypothetical protein
MKANSEGVGAGRIMVEAKLMALSCKNKIKCLINDGGETREDFQFDLNQFSSLCRVVTSAKGGRGGN